MIIEFDNVIPAPLIETYSKTSDIWNSSLVLDGSNRYLIQANSGKGKSTFLQLILGLRFDYSGKIKINNSDIRTFKKSDWTDLRKLHISAVFQDMQLFSSISVLDNLKVKNDLTKKYSESDLIKFLEYFGLEAHKDQICGSMSMGQKQRVAIIRSILQPFECIVLDEPFSHLDETNKKKAMNFILEHASKNKASLIMTSLGGHYNEPWDSILNL